jgi:hypothetical protein
MRYSGRGLYRKICLLKASSLQASSTGRGAGGSRRGERLREWGHAESDQSDRVRLWKYLDERRSALNSLGRFVETLIGRHGDNVVPLRA